MLCLAIITLNQIKTQNQIPPSLSSFLKNKFLKRTHNLSSIRQISPFLYILDASSTSTLCNIIKSKLKISPFSPSFSLVQLKMVFPTNPTPPLFWPTTTPPCPASSLFHLDSRVFFLFLISLVPFIFLYYYWKTAQPLCLISFLLLLSFFPCLLLCFFHCISLFNSMAFSIFSRGFW